MRWPAYFILAYVMLGVQLGVGSYARVRGVGPDLVLLVVVFLSLNAPRAEALLGSFLLGAMQDLVTLQSLGLYAFAYGLVALAVTWSAEFVRRTNPLAQVTMALLGGAITAIVIGLHDVVRPVVPTAVPAGVVLRAVHLGPRVLLVSVLFTTLLAPAVIWPLQRMHRLFGFDAVRRRGRA